MLTDYERAELRGSLRAIQKARASVPRFHRHPAYEKALEQVEMGLKSVLTNDGRALEVRRLFGRPAVAEAKAVRRKALVIEILGCRARSLRQLLPLLKRNRCSCSPGKLGRELRAWAVEGLIVRDVSGRRGGKLWRAADN